MMDKLEALRRMFARTLPERFVTLEKLWKKYLEKPNPLFQDNFHREAHNLVGACGSFGLTEISESAREVELLAAEFPVEINRTRDAMQELSKRCLLLASSIRENNHTETLHADSSLRDQAAKSKISRPVLFLAAERYFDLEFTAQLRLFRFEPEFVTEIPVETNASVIVLPLDSDLDLEQAQLLSESHHIPLFIIAPAGDFQYRLQAVQLGARAFFSVPLAPVPFVDALERWTISNIEEPIRVLLVDEDHLVAEYLSSQIEQGGMLTRIIEDPIRLLQAMTEWRPDVVLLDMNTPRCSGLELASIIRQNEDFLSIPIIFLTSVRKDVWRAKAIQMGCDEFLVKGTDNRHLLEIVRSRARRARKLRALTERDSLTGLFNHTRIKERLVLEVARSQRDNSPLVFAMIDIDHFKSINDTYGHMIGDQVIKNLSRMLKDRFRTTDAVGRYGGEEFAVVLPNATSDNALEIIESLRIQFAQIQHIASDKDARITFSAGICALSDELDEITICAAADSALYLAK
ncbi:MAG: diguanylate cyclase, partial [Myxococcota bacterium]|nr:diguanylate cyclase [Myxococcota bacterium]